LIPPYASVAAQQYTLVVIVVFDSVSLAFSAIAHRNPYITERSRSKNAARCFVEIDLDTIGVQTPATQPGDDDLSREHQSAIFIETL